MITDFNQVRTDQPIELNHEVLAFDYALDGEKELWAGVLHQAVKDAKELFKKGMNGTYTQGKSSFQKDVIDLKGYFQSRSMDGAGFGLVCSWLDLDPDEISNEVISKYLNPLLPDLNINPKHRNFYFQ
jgi:hypothetical protein